MLETSRVYLLLAFFTGISLRYILKFKEIIQEKMLYLDIGIYFFLFAVLSGKVFWKHTRCTRTCTTAIARIVPRITAGEAAPVITIQNGITVRMIDRIKPVM